MASVGALFYFSFTSEVSLPLGWSYVGMTLVTFGFILRQWAIWRLGKMFVPTVAIQDEHALVTDGVYQYVRHPSYTGLFLELRGAALALASLQAVMAITLIMLPALVYRIQVEETVLERHFGDRYRAYAGRTKKLLPFIA